jgi:putative Mn2+ efflux pump MntP
MLALLLVAASVGLSNFAAAIGIGVSGVDARTRLRVGLVFGFFESGMPIVGLAIGDSFATQMGDAGRWLGAVLLMLVGCYGLLKSLRESRSKRAAGGDTARCGAEGGHFGHRDSERADSEHSDSEHSDSEHSDSEHSDSERRDSERRDSERSDSERRDSERRKATGSARLLLTGLALSLDNLVVGFALGADQTGIVTGAVVIGAVSVALSLIGLELGARIGSWAPQRGEQIGGVILISVGIAIASGSLS